MANPVSEIAGNLFGGIFSGGIWVIILILIIGIIGGIMYYFLVYRRKFDILVKITSERASDPKVFFDTAAILYDGKDKTKYFKLLSLNVQLPAPPFKIIEHTNKGDYLELYRKSEDSFAYLTKPKIDKEWIIKTDGKAYPLARETRREIESNFYWIAKRIQEDRRWIKPETLLWKILEWAPVLVSSAFMLIILFIFMEKLPEILSQLSDLTNGLNNLKAVSTPA